MRSTSYFSFFSFSAHVPNGNLHSIRFISLVLSENNFRWHSIQDTLCKHRTCNGCLPCEMRPQKIFYVKSENKKTSTIRPECDAFRSFVCRLECLRRWWQWKLALVCLSYQRKMPVLVVTVRLHAHSISAINVICSVFHFESVVVCAHGI